MVERFQLVDEFAEPKQVALVRDRQNLGGVGEVLHEVARFHVSTVSLGHRGDVRDGRRAGNYPPNHWHKHEGSRGHGGDAHAEGDILVPLHGMSRCVRLGVHGARELGAELVDVVRVVRRHVDEQRDEVLDAAERSHLPLRSRDASRLLDDRHHRVVVELVSHFQQ
ncbi:hypothetical protein H257_17036 [Aphanomyces astaci]|uniref:Uncharacterized protein n=1 Tax=Aphanomyces astaci TaxID=112090 RepID=W4FGI5_APHAT|nr:hypothetical protein H257_17036 [Aphanomyces astaci]ETV66607.1 hypothetical protein H257_17036 [Aphanomyces astaci]|eukprot:XP_009843978.1 hypothetical protein H257_17036 [Aphanomyces astaci]